MTPVYEVPSTTESIYIDEEGDQGRIAPPEPTEEFEEPEDGDNERTRLFLQQLKEGRKLEMARAVRRRNEATARKLPVPTPPTNPPLPLVQGQPLVSMPRGPEPKAAPKPVPGQPAITISRGIAPAQPAPAPKVTPQSQAKLVPVVARVPPANLSGMKTVHKQASGIKYHGGPPAHPAPAPLAPLRPELKVGSKPVPVVNPDYPPMPDGHQVKMTPMLPPQLDLPFMPKKGSSAGPVVGGNIADPDMPKMPNPPCSKSNPDVWPKREPVSKRPIGITRLKEFPGVRCKKCKEAHPTAFCDQCSTLFEVWSFATSEGPCTRQQCNGKKSHATEDCGIGEWRDHPDNRTPKELSEFARPWPAHASKRPLPIYYLEGIGNPPHHKLPKLPKHWEDGLDLGVWDPRLGLHYSVELRIAKVLGKAPPEYKENLFLSDAELGLVPAANKREAPRQERKPINRGSRAAGRHNFETKPSHGPDNYLGLGVRVPAELPPTGITALTHNWFNRFFEAALKPCMAPEDMQTVDYLHSAWEAVSGAVQEKPKRADEFQYRAKQIRNVTMSMYQFYVKRIAAGNTEMSDQDKAELAQLRATIQKERFKFAGYVTEAGQRTLPPPPPSKAAAPTRRNPVQIPVFRFPNVLKQCGVQSHPKAGLDSWNELVNNPDCEEEVTDDDRFHACFKATKGEHAEVQLREWYDYHHRTLTEEKVKYFLQWLKNIKTGLRASVGWATRDRTQVLQVCDDTMDCYLFVAEEFLNKMLEITRNVRDVRKPTMAEYQQFRTRIDGAFQQYNHSISAKLKELGSSGKNSVLTQLECESKSPDGDELSQQAQAESPYNRMRGSALPTDDHLACVLKRIVWPQDFDVEWSGVEDVNLNGERRLRELFERDQQVIVQRPLDGGAAPGW